MNTIGMRLNITSNIVIYTQYIFFTKTKTIRHRINLITE